MAYFGMPNLRALEGGKIQVKLVYLCHTFCFVQNTQGDNGSMDPLDISWSPCKSYSPCTYTTKSLFRCVLNAADVVVRRPMF